MHDSPPVLGAAATRPPRPLHTRIFHGLAAGILAGILASEIEGLRAPAAWLIAQITAPIGQVFLNLLLMLVVPLVFSSLVVGVAGLGDVRKLGRVGIKCFGYCFALSAVSVLIGLTLANTIEPGKKVSAPIAAALAEAYSADAHARVATAAALTGGTPLMQVVDSLVPRNPFSSIAAPTPNMLHLMFYAVALGVAGALLPRAVAGPALDVLQALYAMSVKLIDLVMRVAPYAVGCLVFNNVATFGLDLLQSLGWFVGTVLLGLGLHMFVVYSAVVYWFAGLAPLDFFRRIQAAMLTAFSTSSSNATLPTALRVGEERLGVPREINSFVLTVGATANQNGTALFEGVTVLFIAQLAGVELSLGQQLTVVYLAILGGIGTAGVPAGSIPFVIGILASIGVNPALIAVVIGVDRILDMCRTALNVTGDLSAAAYVARSEGHALEDPSKA